ncbi:MAG: gluconate 2-dehydrogenase subunit 3 family protein [Caldimonas sp.]
MGLSGGLFSSRSSSAASAGQLPKSNTSGHFEFLIASEVAFIDAAVDRLIPSDALGQGAVEAGVTVFIDRQLAGPFGKAVDWYMQGPWAKGTEQQGYQRRRTPAEVYRAAIKAIDAKAQQTRNMSFDALTAAEQDDVLHALEDDKIDLGDVSAKTFFTLLWQNTQEGFFADPIYLGNRNFVGWKLIGYPGPRYNYDGAIRHFGERYPLPTVGLMGRDPSRQPAGPL